MKPDKILYFIDGPLPTTEDYAAAAELRANVMFRNALAVPAEGHSLEPCDGVAGEVPLQYAKAYPPAEAAIAKTRAQLKALQDKIGDKPPSRPGEPSKLPEHGATLPTRPEGGTLPSEPTGGATAKQPVWAPNTPPAKK